MAFLSFMIIFFSTLPSPSTAADAIGRTQSIRDGETLVSSGERFEMGFFTPGSSKKRYLGIWFKKVRLQTVVWVANRDTPLNDSTGLLKFNERGNLVLLNSSGSVVWSPRRVASNASNPVVQLRDIGNLVVRDGDKHLPDGLLWQSFDEPGSVLLPGMLLGVNTRTGANWYLTSWKSPDDPTPGRYTFRLDTNKLPQLLLLDGSRVRYRTGPWNGLRFSGVQLQQIIMAGVVTEDDDVYFYSSEINWNSTISFSVLDPSGVVQRVLWDEQRGLWDPFLSVPSDECDRYANCGSYGFCSMSTFPVCGCLRGFEPRSPDWSPTDNIGGCVRTAKLQCGGGDGFLRLTGVKLPDVRNSAVNVNASLDACREKCAGDCSCTAYASVTDGGEGCITWYGELVDMRDMSRDAEVQEIHVRVPASFTDPTDQPKHSKKRNNKGKAALIGPITAVLSGMLVLVLCGHRVWMKRKKMKAVAVEGKGRRGPLSFGKDEELPLFDFETIASATANFSISNKIGEGGFGVVYKGIMEHGQEVAVKRLSTVSLNGLNEFTNEVMLIAKLRHRNLVRLLGCCVAGEERMLIYEYMPNKSLDAFLFDEKKRALLGWRTRLDIILGIARGLIYLHHDSGFRIIHRDLKPGNILLDRAMDPKISDFGTARIFGADQMLDKTRKVVGTYGYMSPEYVMDGIISMKADIFSFGVLLLEIVSGIRNRGLYQTEPHQNLLSLAWRLWQENNCIELLDDAPTDSCPQTEALRCIHVGLLCVQERARDRPTMSSVVVMLSSETFPLPPPKRPAFLVFRRPDSTSASSSRKKESDTPNGMTITIMEGR